MIKYKDFIIYLKEGLIFTHNIEKYQTSLEIQLSSLINDFEINIINKFIFTLEIKNSNTIDNKILKYIPEMIINLFGYYPSFIWLINNENMKNYFKFNEKYLNSKYKNIKIRFESKYDDGLYRNDLDVPDYAYHLTPQKNKAKILKNGLYPKTYNRNTRHPERIYLFYNMNKYESLLNSLKINDLKNNNNYKYMLLKIDMDKNHIIHTDPNYSDGFFMYDNICIKNIDILKEDL